MGATAAARAGSNVSTPIYTTTTTIDPTVLLYVVKYWEREPRRAALMFYLLCSDLCLTGVVCLSVWRTKIHPYPVFLVGFSAWWGGVMRAWGIVSIDR